MIILSCLLLFFYWINRGDIFSPTFIFTASFAFSTLWACAYVNKWNLDLQHNTFYVICGGVLLFGLACCCVRAVSININREKIGYWVKFNISYIHIQKAKIYMFIIFEILTILLTIKFLGKATGNPNLVDAIFMYRYQFDELSGNTDMPAYVNLFRGCVNAAGYWFAYIFANNLIATKRIPVLELVVVILSIINGITLGGEYSCEGVPLFQRNGYRQSGGRKPLYRNRDTALN